MMIFAGGVYVSENTSQAASVEFVGHRHTNYARSRLQALCLKIPWIFRHRKSRLPQEAALFCAPAGLTEFAAHRRRLFSHLPQLLLPPRSEKSLGFFTAALLPRQNPLQ